MAGPPLFARPYPAMREEKSSAASASGSSVVSTCWKMASSLNSIVLVRAMRKAL